MTLETADILLAETCLRRLDLTLRASDAMHIAMTRRAGATLVTFDIKMKTGALALGSKSPTSDAMTTPEKTPIYLEYVLCLTAFAAGSVDVISFVRLGGIFASAMTGNLAFLGIYIERFAFFSAIGSAVGLAGFIIGSALGHIFTRGKSRPQALNILLGIEFCLLLGVAVLWFPVGHKNGSLSAYALISMLSISMGLQSIIGKKINLSSIPTVVFTSTLTNLVIGLADALAAERFMLPQDTRRQATSLCIYFGGALVAGIAAYLKFSVLVLIPVSAIALALAIKRLQNAE